ncbi:dystonin-like protein short stop isoform 18-T20 [Glossina fuscipes fuscipes]
MYASTKTAADIIMDRESLSEWAKDKPLSILQLDPADRAVLRIADERDAIQKKTFTKWVNKHLKKANRRVEDLFEDLRDGHNLLSLLEVLSGEHLPREKGKMRFHMLQNAQMALDFLRYKKIKLVNIRAEDIVDGNPKLTLGLIWTIILHFQISDIVVGKEDNVSAREALLSWARRSTSRYPGVRVNDFTTSWRDGLAFSALVHRNRPDLLDWRKARTIRPSERLENAFYIAEKEYGVTRLLDPEDVDTNEPDEKSLITYISSLYDVFPEPPSIHPLFDVESQRRVQEYRDLARQYIYWCREKSAYLQERTFPSNLIELKRLLNDLHHFRSEEVSARKREKLKLVQIYKELERYFESIGEIDVAPELRPDAIEKAWYRMQTALQDREIILQQEIERLERLQRLAEKVQREIKHIEVKLTDIETHISEETVRIDRLHPVDAKNIVESFELELRHMEEPIQNMNQDCHLLSEGHYNTVEDLHKKVNKVHQRWAQLRATLHTNLVQKLSGLKYPIHETTLTRQTRMVVESRQIETNQHFRNLQEHIEWCQTKLKQLLAADFGSDLGSVKEELDRQQYEHKIIDQFHVKILNDERHQNKFINDELHLYQQRLNQLQKVYAELLSTSTKRLSDLDSLQHFLIQASAELQWLNEKEQIEISRDWADKNLDLSSVHRYYENLMSDLEKRELHFGTILDRGETLLNQQHPASKCIESHLTVLQQQWAWLLQLTLCLEVHLKHATEYHQFFAEIKDAEQWLINRDETLNNKYSQSDFGLDQGENLLRGMQDLREEFNAFGETVANLQHRAQTIVPLTKRRQPLSQPGSVQAICAYQQQGQIQIDKGETCTLLDNSGRLKWRVRTSKDFEGPIPSACLLIPPPDKEATTAAERLKRLFDRSINLWQKKHLRLRQNMIFATIRVVKSWDFDQFLAMGPEQRTAIRRALNDDADKLLSEGDPNDPQLRRLSREMEEVNRLFDEFEKRARAEEESKKASRIFTEECVSVKAKLEDMARELEQNISAPLPRDVDSLDHVLQIHSDYERRLHLLDPELQHLQETFRTIVLKTPALKKSLDSLMVLWKELSSLSNLHKDRLKLLETSLIGLDDNEHFISEIENELGRHRDLPSTPEGLQMIFKQLSQIQEAVTQQQPHMEKMTDAADQLGRMGVPSKVLNDLKRLHSNVERLNTRWSAICNQLAERMRSCENAIVMMKNLHSSIQVEESWVDGTTEKLSAMPAATSAYELDKMLGEALERKAKIENINLSGKRLLREAKIYDSKCLHFIDWLLEVRPSFSPPHQDWDNIDPVAVQNLSIFCNNLNTKFQYLLEQLYQRLQVAIDANEFERLKFAESLEEPLKILQRHKIPTTKNYDCFTTTNKTTTQYASIKDIRTPIGIAIAISEGDSQTEKKESANLEKNIELENNRQVPDCKALSDISPGCSLRINEATQPIALNVNAGRLLASDDRIPLGEAVNRKLIDVQPFYKLMDPRSDSETKNISQLEVLQEEYNRKKADREAMVKPNEEKNLADIDKLDKFKTINRNSDTETITPDYVVRHESVTIKSNALCLSDAIEHGLVNSDGWIADRNSGERFKLDVAIAKQIIDPSIREVVDVSNDSKITVEEAIRRGILNVAMGHYINESTEEKLSFHDAKTLQLITKPCTLKDVCDKNLMDKMARITSPMCRKKLTITEAIEVGVLDFDSLKCITRKKGELVTLQNAIKDDIILPAESQYRNFSTGEIFSIPEAVERGLISSVRQTPIFDIDGFKDRQSNDFFSFNVALSRGILHRSSSGFTVEIIRDTYKSLEEAMIEGLIRSEVYEMFHKKVGIKNASGKEFNLLDLCYHNLINPKSGCLLDPKSGQTIPLDIALKRKFITAEGALRLSSLLNITLTTETVTRTVNRYVTIHTKEQLRLPSTKALSFTEAIRQELVDEDKQMFTDPNTGMTYSIQQALTYGLLGVDSNDNLSESAKKFKSTITIMAKQRVADMDPNEANLQQYVDNYLDIPFTENHSNSGDLNDKFIGSDQVSIMVKENSQTAKCEIFSPEPLQIAPGIIYDPSTALVIFIQSGQTENILKAARLGLIDDKLIRIFDPETQENISLRESVDRKIYDPELCSILAESGCRLNIITAIQKGVLTVSGTPLVAAEDALHLVKFIANPSTNEQITAEVAYERGTIAKDNLITQKSIARAMRNEKIGVFHKIRKVRLKLKEALEKGAIDGETYGILKNEQNFINENNERLSISEAIDLGFVDGNKGKVVDPQRNCILNLHEAVDAHIIDSDAAGLLIPLVKSLSIPKLMEQGLIDTKTNKIIHPESACFLNIHEAIICEILDPFSKIKEPAECTIIDAFEKKIIDADECTFKVNKKSLSLTESIALNIFETKSDLKPSLMPIPPVGMTFAVIVERGLLKTKPASIIHPELKIQIPLQKAIKEGFIMSIPYPPKSKAIGVIQAVEEGLINVENKTFSHPDEDVHLSIRQALEKGVLVVKPICEFVASQRPTPQTNFTDSVNTAHEISTKTIELTQEYVLISNDEFRNIETQVSRSTSEGNVLETTVSDNRAKTKHLNSFAQISNDRGQSCVSRVHIEKNYVPEVAEKPKPSSSYTTVNKAKEALTKGTTGIVAAHVLAGASIVSGIKEFNSGITKGSFKKGKKQKKRESNEDVDTEQNKLSSISEQRLVRSASPVLHDPDNSFKDLQLEANVFSDRNENQVEIKRTQNVDTEDHINSPRSSKTNSTCPGFKADVTANTGQVPFDLISQTTAYEPKEESLKNNLMKCNKMQWTSQKVNNFGPSPYLVNTSDQITIENLSRLNVYDKNNEHFTNPSTGSKIPFHALVSEMNIFNPETTLVKNFTTEQYESLTQALERPLLDRNNGHMVDPKTGTKISFFESVHRNWIVLSKINERKQAAIENVINKKTGEVILEDGRVSSIVDAINNGVIDIQSISVRDPVSGEVIPLRMAIELGVVDMQAGTVIDIQTLQEIPMEDAFKLGFLVPGSRKPISLEAAVRQGLYDPATGKLYDLESNNQVDVQRSIEIGLINPKISLIVDTTTKREIKLDCALEDDLVVTEIGKIKDKKANILVSLDVGLERKLLKTDHITWSLPEMLQREYYIPRSGKILNPITGEEICIRQAIEFGVVELDSCLIKNDEKSLIVSSKQAIKEGLLDIVQGTLSCPNIQLDEAFVKGYIFSTKKPLSLVDCLLREIYDPNTARFSIDEESVDLQTALVLKLINSEELILLDPKNDCIISLREAISKGYIDPIHGLVISPYSNTGQSLPEALESRILIPHKRKRSLPDAVYRGLYDPKTGVFSNTITREKLSTECAIRRGILDPNSTIVNTADKVLSFEMAIASGFVDTKKGTVKDKYNRAIDYKEAFDRGILIETQIPISLMEAIIKRIYNEQDDTFMDPRTGKKLSLSEAIENKLLDEESVQIKDSNTDLYEEFNLSDAKATGLIDSCSAVLIYNNQKFTIKDAFDVGILNDTRAPISLQKALHRGLFDEIDGKFVDPNNKRKLTLLEAIRNFVINSQLPCYFDAVPENMHDLAETCHMGIINCIEGVFRVPGSNTFISLHKALKLGLIVDIENSNFGLYELLAMKFYDVATRKVVHPVSGRRLSLKEACAEGIVSSSASLVKNHKTGQYTNLAFSIKHNFIDDINGCYNLSESNQIDLQEARAQGLIVSNRRYFDLELIMKMRLLDSESGTFCDPISGDFCNLLQGIQSGLINATTTAFKNLATGEDIPLILAIEKGDVDVEKGRVFDHGRKISYNYDVAMRRGVFVTMTKAMSDEDLVRRHSRCLNEHISGSVSFNGPREMSLEEAIAYKIIDPKFAFVRDYKSHKEVSFEIARQSGIIDLSKRTFVDPEASIFQFDATSVIFASEPITFDRAVEINALDLKSGVLTYINSSKCQEEESVNNAPEFKVYSLKDAITKGIMDPDSAFVKDLAKSKLVRLPEAFRKGLIDANQANVVNTKTSKICSLQEAYESGLLITPKRSFSLIEAITFKLYIPSTGTFIDPFHTNGNITKPRTITLAEAITNGLIEPSSTVIRNSSTGEIIPFTAAINVGLVDSQKGCLLCVDHSNVDFAEAAEKGLLLKAEQRQAVFEKFNLCEQNVTNLLEWVNKIEHKIANIGGPREKMDELRNQINAIKQIKDEIESQQRSVATCSEQIRQIVLTGGDVLSAPEIATVESAGRELRSRVDRANDRVQRLLRRLDASRDELTKLRSELDIFSAWLQSARHILEDKERSLSDLSRLSTQVESIREFVSDVIGHQADLRFITMATQKFVDESKEFLAILNDFRTSLPERLPHVEPLPSTESSIRQEVSLASAHYKDLMNRVNALQDRISGLSGRQREYQESIDKVNEWLRSIRPHALRIIGDPIGEDSKSVQEQMSEAKALYNELLSNGRLVDYAQQTLDSLLRTLGTQLNPAEIKLLELPITELKESYQGLLDSLGEHCKNLDRTLVQSQGVQDALESLSNWVTQAEEKYKLQLRLASLIKERLQEQMREHKAFLADVQSHQISIDSVYSSAQLLVKAALSARIAKMVENNLNDITNKFNRLFDKAVKRGEFFDDIYNKLCRYLDEITNVEQSIGSLQEAIDSRDTTLLTAEDQMKRMIEISNRKEKFSSTFDDCMRHGKDLITIRDVTDTSLLRDRIKALESQWRNFTVNLEDKMKLSKQKSEHRATYENLKSQVLIWLAGMESRIAGLDPVAIDLNKITQQNDELKPIFKDYREYASTIDKINDIGAHYDALIRPESPSRKRSIFSPIKRVSPLRRMSGETRSPSPTKGGILSPLSTGSSGFGSRRSSQDGFQLTEISPVQQQLSEINNRYGLIGVRLNDRQNELDNMNEEIRKQYENLKNLSIFLDRIHRQLPKETISNKDEVDRCNKQAKRTIEDMYEKQSLLDTTKTQIKDILRRKSEVYGADQLRTENENVLDKWKHLSEACKNCINFSDKLRDFLDTHNNLKNWLDSKERMLTVLGPISSDPRMVQSQVQQVQVLREEFRTQQPQLKHFQEIGQSILNYPHSETLDGVAVSKKLQDIDGKWEDLVSRLDERANCLGGAADSSKEFDAAVSRLKEALQQISDNLDILPSHMDYQEKLRKIENLERQLEGQRPLLADAEQSATALCNILGDSASRADVNSRVVALGKQYQTLQKKLDTKKAETEATLRNGRQFTESCSKTLGWLSGELTNLNERLLVSAHKPSLQHQVDSHEPIYREIMAREHEIIMLLNKGKDLSDLQQDRIAKRDLDRIQQQWEKLRREAVERHTRLQTCMEYCRKYIQNSEIFLTWLRLAEDKLNSFAPGVLSKSKLENHLRDLQAFRSEVWKHSNDYENTKVSGETFLNSCDIDKESISKELRDIHEKWESLNNDLIARAQEIENYSRRLGDFNDELRNLNHDVSRCEDRLAAHDALGGTAKDAKLVERVKTIREELRNLQNPLQRLKNMANEICVEIRALGGDAEHLIDDVDNIADRITELERRLNDRLDVLQSVATAVSHFNDKVKVLATDINELENEIENLSAPAREIQIVQVQYDETTKLRSKIDRAAEGIEECELAADALVDAGFSPDAAQTREQISILRKNLMRLDNRLRSHSHILEETLLTLQNFYEIQSHTLNDIHKVVEEFRLMKPVASELDHIRRQQEDFRNFRMQKLESLCKNVDKVNITGRDLVRSAASGVSTNNIEKDLENLNECWNDLKERMNERDRRLDVALLHSGKFQEALEGLAKWLSDTEEMVKNQKAPSSDYKVIKAQLQEQKFLKKMLLDRQNSMSSLSSLSKEVISHTDISERSVIEKQLQDLMERFDTLTYGAERRERDLEETMGIAKRFHDKINPLQLWLDTTERTVKSMELVPTDEEKIQQRILEHERLHNEILEEKPNFSQMADIASQLMHLISDDEAVNLSEKVRKITDRYTELVDSSENIGSLLNESRKGLRHLVLTYQDLAAWMEHMEIELKRFHSVPVFAEKLLEQMDLLLQLNENIANHAPNVESTVECGAELMKHISNDEALQLKDKLDSLQRRYGELTNRGGDLLKNSQNALPLVQQFHGGHSRLIEWMQIAETSLSLSEPRQFDVLRLEGELAEMRTVLDVVNLVGPQLCQISPGEGAAVIENIVTRDNRRFDAIVEQIQRKAERLHLSNQRAKEVMNGIDELLEWFRDMDATLRDAELPAIEPKLVRGQLQEHRSINDDISGQKGRVRDITAASKKVLRESPQSDNTSTLREKLEDLKEIVETVVQLCSERLSTLEQALPLSEHFADSHAGLSAWFDDMEAQISRLSTPALRPDQISQQQDRNERLLQSILEHKPLLDKLNKTGEALGALVTDDDSGKINEILTTDSARYSALRQEVRERQQALENALQESSQFSDKIEGLLRALTNTVEQVNQLDPLSALPQKIREQIEDNAAIGEDLEKRADAFNAVQRAANDVIAKAGNKSDPAIRDIKSKLEKLNTLWSDVKKATKRRGSSLNDILSLAESFWNQLLCVMKSLKDLEENLSAQEAPAAQPQEIQKQQVALQEIRYEIDQTKPEVEQVRRRGNNLMSMCGEPDKPEVKKHIDDLDNAWDNITALYAKREENLIDAMEKAMEFHETLQKLLQFLTNAEENFTRLGQIGTDIDAVKQQIDQLRSFKDEVDPHMVKIEALNRQAIELTERTSPEQAASIREPLLVVNRRWDSLLRCMVERQKQLEHALLHLGQFQHALSELLVWINKTDITLDQLKPIPGDPQLLEVELAKLKVLANDIQAHQNSVDTLNDAGRHLIESEKGSLEASTTQEKLRKLNQEWKTLLQKSSDRQHELEESLREAHGYISEVQDILGWLGDVDAVIGASKPVGGLPETAAEQLERFMEVYNELEENRPKVETIQTQGQEYIKKQNQIKVSSSNLQHTLRTLKQRWDAVISRASDKKIKLEIALKEATEFHETLQTFVEWLNQAEKQLANAQPVSRVLETIQAQMEDHKILQKDVSTHREAMLLLDKKGTHLKYFSQKQDVILIKNLLVSVQHRWERIVSKAAERTRALDHGYKEAREFNDSWSNMMQYLEETEAILDQIIEEAANTKEPQKIKKCISKIKDTHRQLTGKQSSYDSTMRSGKNLIERAPKSDEPIMGKMLCDLKDRWSRVLLKSIERQRKLEEALLLSGQFSDALGELLDWLKKAESILNQDGLVHGDLETVQGLWEQHKHLEQDLQKRSTQMQSVLKTGRGLERSGNNPDIGLQLDELQSIWDEVKNDTAKRGERLQQALKDAEKLNKNIQGIFDWLDHAEHKLRYAKNAPDDERISREMMETHKEFMADLSLRERQKVETFKFAEEIISKAYPDAIPIIKNWLNIIEERWEEVKQWGVNRESKLEQHLQSLKDLDDTIEKLLIWLNGLEATLLNLERESLPDEIAPLEKLIEDHKEFMENTARRQAEIDRACKPKQLTVGSRKTSRAAKTPVRGSSHDIREQSPDGTLRRQSFKGSRDYGLNVRKSGSRITPNRDTPDRDRLPHYGPRFSPSSVGSELEFRSSRAKLLWDKWRQVWMLSWERQRRLNDHLMYLKDLERVRNFSWDDWRKRFLKYMNHKKSRLTDLFRKMDKDNNGLIPRGEFIDGILNTKFDTSRMEMGAVADLFDRNGEGLIDWQEFIAALRPDWQERKPVTDSDKIHDEVKRLVMLCTCRQKFRVFQVGEGKYRFGDSQKLRLVRILRSTVMVRVGGGWVALDEFLQKNDPCRADEHLAELMPIFERIRAQEQVPCAFPIHMGAAGGTIFMRCNNSRSVPLSPHVIHCHPTTLSVRERSVRSIPMSKPSRSSLSASTPDSLSDNEGNQGGNTSGRYTPRKVTYTSIRTGLTPSASRPNSKPNSRPLSRQGSKPSSRQGSTLSLDSTDEATPSRIPQRKASSGGTGSNPRPSRLSVTPTTSRTNGAGAIPRKTASGSASPAPTIHGGMIRSSSIPALTGFGFKPSIRTSRIPIKISLSENSSPTCSALSSANYNFGRSGTSTPSGLQTPRKNSGDPSVSSNMRRTSRGTTPVEKREPFRL